MIKADFYPTRYTAAAGEYTDAAWTLARNGEYTPENFANPYMMGYIPAQEVPVPLFLSNATVDGEDENRVIHFRRANNENMLWGLSMAYGSNGSSWDGDHFYYSTNNATWTQPQRLNTYSSYFINKAEVINYQNSGYYAIEYVSVKHNQDDTWSDGTINSLLKVYKTAEQIRKFIAGEENWTLEIAGKNTVDVNYSMVNDYGMLEYDGGDYTIYFCFYGIVQQGGASSCAVSVVSGRGTSMVPFFKFSGTNANTEDATICFTASSAPGHFDGVSYNSSSHTINSPSFSSHPVYNGMFLGITDGDLPVSEIPSRANYKVYNQFFMYGSGIKSAIPLTEAYKFICIPNKFYKNATSFGNVPASASYNQDYTVALFNKSNKPLWTRATGSFASILPKLQPWQYPGTDISENDFDPDKIGPGPGPGTDPGTDPDDGDEEDDAPDKQDWGDPMNPSNGFDIPYGFANYKAFNNAGIINFAERLWDAPDDFWEALTIANKNNANWLDYFISLRAYPYWINSTGEEANIYVGAGGKFYLGDEGTNLYAANPQHITFYVLNFTIDKHYNNFLDFAPYTKAYIYLPFSGTWEVNPKYLYHTSLQLLLKLDITDGSGVWQLIRSGADTAGSGYIILEKQCKIGVEIPLSGLNATTMSSNIVNATLGNYQRTGKEMGKIAGTIASGAALGGPVGAVAGMAAGAAMTGLENSVDMANANREHISVNGGMSGLAAANCNVIPSITLVRPIAQNPDSFPHTIGYLVNKAATLSSLNGFTTCRNVDVTNVGQATDKEKAQLKKILESGFYA